MMAQAPLMVLAILVSLGVALLAPRALPSQDLSHLHLKGHVQHMVRRGSQQER